MRVTLTALGGGDFYSCTWESIQALKEADMILGAQRMLDSIPKSCTDFRVAGHDPEILLARILEADVEEAVVVYSGDTGFYSGTRLLVPLLEREDIDYRVLPGISSVQLLASKLGVPWQDWNLVSAHGVDCNVLAEVMKGKSTCFLTGGRLKPETICGILNDAGLGFLEAVVGSDLTYPNEELVRGTISQLAVHKFPTLSVLLVDPAPLYPKRTPGIPDSAFLRGDVPLSKQPIRAAALSQMQVAPNDIIWDIGAGTGGVSVELALAANEGTVYSVERNPDACQLVARNREKFCAWNLELIEGEAPEVLESLPAPDKVFIGGSGGEFRAILETVLEKNPDALVCADAIAMETVTEAWSSMSALDLDPHVLQISAAATKPAGKLHLLLSNNPAFLIVGNEND